VNDAINPINFVGNYFLQYNWAPFLANDERKQKSNSQKDCTAHFNFENNRINLIGSGPL
jgi:hypothetical protein